MIPENFELTQNQSEIFYLLAHGYTVEMISYILGVNCSSTADTIRRVKKKLSAVSIRHAVAILVTFGCLHLDTASSAVTLRLMQRQQLFAVPDYELDDYPELCDLVV